jgi:hypothetical protein
MSLQPCPVCNTGVLVPRAYSRCTECKAELVSGAQMEANDKALRAAKGEPIAKHGTGSQSAGAPHLTGLEAADAAELRYWREHHAEFMGRHDYATGLSHKDRVAAVRLAALANRTV